MQRVKTATAIAVKPVYTAEGTPGYFRSGDAVAAIPPTVPGPDWFNMVQEEIVNVILAAGLALNPEDDTQLADAIAAMIAAQAVTVGPASTTEAGIVELATNAEAITGSDAVRAITAAALAAVIAAKIGVSLQAYDAATALTNAAQGWTRQQRPVPVLRTGASGDQAVDCDLHQLLGITSTAAITMLEASHMAEGAEVTLMFTSASPQTISWSASWKDNANLAKPTATVANKWITAHFVCQRNPSTTNLEMVLMGLVYGA